MIAAIGLALFLLALIATWVLVVLEDVNGVDPPEYAVVATGLTVMIGLAMLAGSLLWWLLGWLWTYLP